MIVSGKVVDSTDGVGVPGASVAVVDSSGNALGPGTAAGNDGSFVVSSSLLDNDGAFLKFSSVGYESKQALPSAVDNSNVGLVPVFDTLNAVTVTPRTNKNISLGVVAAGAAGFLLFALADGKKKKKVGKVDATGTVLIIGGVAVAGFLAYKFFIAPNLQKAQPPVVVVQKQDPTAQIVSSVASSLPGILNSVSSFF